MLDAENLNINKMEFDGSFNVYSLEGNFSFFHIEIEDTFEFYEKLFDYFFSEERLIKYCENKKNISFNPSEKHFAILYKHLLTYIDKEKMIEIDISDLDDIILQILKEERRLTLQDGKQFVRNDKIGKIGEYIFCCLLSDFFNFDCIIPKVHLQTDYNMSIYGIDTLFYSEQDNILLFGESKLCKTLNNGVGLINKSLKEYEQQMDDEFKLVLSNRFYKDKLNKFNERFGDDAEICVDILDFLETAGIERIGIPIFIAHGVDANHNEILKKLSRMEFPTFFGRETIYYSISLPIINKDKLIATFTGKIREKAEEYYNYATTK